MGDNGSVFRRSDGRICAKYKDADGKTRYLYRKTKTEAKQALRVALRDRDEGISPSKLTVNDVLVSWLVDGQHEVAARTLDNRNWLVRTHFQNHPIARIKLANLNHSHLSDYMKSKRNLAPSTRQKLLSVLKHVGAEGVRLRVLRHNPVSDIKPPRQEHRELDILTADQIKQLLKTIEGHRYELIVMLGATCGVRVGEALGACWEDIDFDRGTIEIKRTVWRGKVYPPKTKTSRRTLKVPQRALEGLERRYKTAGYLCPTNSGNPTAASNFHHQWKVILEDAGLPRATTFHALRHGAASLLLNQSVPIPVVSRYLGHSNPAITMRVYAHMIDGMGGMAASGMDDALS